MSLSSIRAGLLAWTLVLLAPIAARAEPTTCPSRYLDGRAPDIVDAARRAKVQEFCYGIFALYHSSETRTPIWSAEKLTREMVVGGRSIGRKAGFHAEAKLDHADRSEYADYTNSGFNRGHMSPADDAPDYESQFHTFVMTNMVPQKGKANSGLWRYLEASIAQRAFDTGLVWVVTGPVFDPTPAYLNGRVAVPIQTFKAIYDPKTKLAVAFIVDNLDKPTCRVVSIAALQARTGLDVFPSLTTQTKSQMTAPPLPKGPATPVPNCH